MNGRTLSPGYQHMDGQAVLDYCRMRKGSSDIARVDRQQRMIQTIVRQLKTSGQIGNVPAIYTALEKNIETNLSLTQIASLALSAARMDMSQLERYTVGGEFLNLDEISYWGIHSDELAKLVKSVFGVKIDPDPDIDAQNIRSNIEEWHEDNSQVVQAAQSILSVAERLQTEYGMWVDPQTLSEMSAYVSMVDVAVGQQDAAQIADNAPRLVTLCKLAIAQVQAYNVDVPQEMSAALTNAEKQLAA
jgi:hypothetical protein